ncbi:fungal specific transcription factor domain-containing protein [Botrytis cinerea]
MSITTAQVNPSIALFGATGGTGLAILNEILSSSSTTHLNVLCRTPSKLSQFSNKTIYPNLHIIQGDIRDATALKSALIDPATNLPVDIVVSSLGMTLIRSSTFSMKWSDPTLCQDGVKKYLEHIGFPRSRTWAKEREDESDRGEHDRNHLGKTPFEDKIRMEEEIVRWAGEGEGKRWMAVRPSLLINGEAKRTVVKIGWEFPGAADRKSEDERENDVVEKTEEGEDKLEIGYQITRGGVGKWIYEEGIRNGGRSEWEGRFMSLTY